MADLTINTQLVLASANKAQLDAYAANEQVQQGELVYLNDSNRWVRMDADSSSTGNEITRTRGVALNFAYANQPLAVALTDPGFVPGATLTQGQTYVASNAAGNIAPIGDIGAGWYRTVVGVAINSTHLNLNPSATGATA